MMLSKTFFTSGIFTGDDQLADLRTDKEPFTAAPVTGIGAEPWEDEPIEIVCIDIVFFNDCRQFVKYAFAGNGYWPDVMRWHGHPNPIPLDDSFPFPAKGDERPAHWPDHEMWPPHIDLHVSGRGGTPFRAFYTAYYRKVGQ